MARYDDNGTQKVFEYDSRGNVTAMAGQSFRYDMADQPRIMSGIANGVYSYDGNLKRVKSDLDGVIHYNVYDSTGTLVHVEKGQDGTGFAGEQTDYLRGAGMAIARSENGKRIIYMHSDHLGSNAVQTSGSSSGGVITNVRYSPYGELLTDASAYNNDQAGFTGHIRDSATGLNYMQARYHDPVSGRFLSVDAMDFMGSGGNPQYFNRYAYTFNDPVNNLDPDGNVVETAWDAANVAMGVASFSANAAAGNVVGATVDAVGIVVDTAATLTPFVPGGAGTAIKDGRAGLNALDGAGDAKKAGQSFDKAREAAFEKAGMTDGKVKFTMEDKATGTITEFTGAGGAKVNYDGPHPNTPGKPGDFHDQNHVGHRLPGNVVRVERNGRIFLTLATNIQHDRILEI